MKFNHLSQAAFVLLAGLFRSWQGWSFGVVGFREREGAWYQFNLLLHSKN